MAPHPAPAATWAEAMERSLHGTAAEPGFYRRGSGPGSDFRTASTLAPELLAAAVAALLSRLPADAGRSVVEIGAGTGQLLDALAGLVPDPVTLLGVDRRPRPPGLAPRIGWAAEMPPAVRGVLLAVEWLDTVPVDVVVGERRLVVDAEGRELAGPPLTPTDRAWLQRWWPQGERREVGHRRDVAWAGAVARLERGIAVAVDYGHLRSSRPDGGSLAGYRAGRQVQPVPDGRSDLTAAVAWDACAAAGERAVAGAVPSAARLVGQRAALLDLGVGSSRVGRSADPAEVLAGLGRASRAARLLDPAGLGGFGWLLHAVGVPAELLPAAGGGS